MPRHETLHFTCDGCEAPTGHLENDIADDEIDTAMPPGWTQVIARRVMANPSFAPTRTPLQIAQELAAGVPPEERQAAIAGLMPMAQMQAQAEAAQAEPRHMVDEIGMYYCPTCSVSGIFDTEDALLEAGWTQPKAPATAPPPVQEVPPAEPDTDEAPAEPEGGAA